MIAVKVILVFCSELLKKTTKNAYLENSKIIFPGGEKIVTYNGIRGNAHPNHTYTCVRENATEWHPEF